MSKSGGSAPSGAGLKDLLRGTEDRLALLADAMPFLISYVDRELVYQFANKAYEEWFGVSRDQVIGRSVTDVVGPDVLESLGQIIPKALAGEPSTYETILPYKHGGHRHVHGTVIPFFGADGAVEGLYTLVEDISERKRADVSGADGIEAAFEQLAAANVDAIILPPDEILAEERAGIIARARAAGVPTLFGSAGDIEACGLVAYFADTAGMAHAAARYVAAIENGARPQDLPMEDVALLLGVNLATAGSLGFVIPDEVLTRADTVIQ